MAELTIQQAFDLAAQHHQAGRLTEAEQIYRRILAVDPGHVDAMQNLGALAHQVGRNDVAIDLIRQAIGLRPSSAGAHHNLGNALRATRQLDGAIAAYRQAISLDPHPGAGSYYSLGNALKEKGLLDEAIAAYRNAIALNPGSAEGHHTLGRVLEDKGEYDEAIAEFRQAIALKPDFHEAYCSLGIVLIYRERLDEAINACQKAIALKREDPEAYDVLGIALKEQGRLDEAVAAHRTAIGLRPGDAGAHSNLIFAMQYQADYDAGGIAEECRQWNHRHAEPLRKFIQSHSNDPNANRRLRVGYVSPDFRDHVVGRNLLPLFQHHDRGQFEIFCYSQVYRPDGVTNWFEENVDGWRNIVGVTDEQAAEQIRADRIDILVDLALHTGHNRLLIFARKPSPVQVSFAGYPGSTGLETIDYRLTDPYLEPAGLYDHLYSERSLRLPESFWCYAPLRSRDIRVNSLPALEAGFVTFGCLNNFCKINERVLQLWAQVLKAVDRSRMMIRCPHGSHRQALLDFLQRQGIQPDRIELVTHRPQSEYLELYHRIDVGLDTFPYNGHTTSLDSYWMGVPVVTLVGKTVVGRAGLSQLSNLGLTELIAETPEEYVRIAAALAGDVARMKELRRTLRPRMEASPLMDGRRFARNIESAYRQMWRAWCETALR